MNNRYSRRDRWGDRDRVGDFSDADRDDRQFSDQSPYRPNERYFGQGDMFGRGYGSEEGDYRQQSWRSGSSYTPDDRDGGRRYGRSRYSQGSSNYGRNYDRDRNSDSWIGRSNFETGWGGHGTNRYTDRSSSDPYWTADTDNDRDDRRDRGWWDRASDEVASWFGDDDAQRRREADEGRQNSYRGRGPKNYTRSDDRIREDINDRLTDDYALDAGDIEVEVTGGEVVLSGTVNSRYEKRRAEDVAEDISGVKNVENRLRVNDYQQSSWGSMTNDQDQRSGTSSYSSTGSDQHSRSVGGSS